MPLPAHKEMYNILILTYRSTLQCSSDQYQRNAGKSHPLRAKDSPKRLISRAADTIQVRTQARPRGPVQSIVPAQTLVGTSSDEVYTKIENSLIQSYLEGDSYMAKVFGGGMTNARALQVCHFLTFSFPSYCTFCWAPGIALWPHVTCSISMRT